VKEVAAALRFSDGSHFAKWFRRLTGAGPGERRLEW
jgi:AraC-like DNA-binding protein